MTTEIVPVRTSTAEIQLHTQAMEQLAMGGLNPVAWQMAAVADWTAHKRRVEHETRTLIKRKKAADTAAEEAAKRHKELLAAVRPTAALRAAAEAVAACLRDHLPGTVGLRVLPDEGDPLAVYGASRATEHATRRDVVAVMLSLRGEVRDPRDGRQLDTIELPFLELQDAPEAMLALERERDAQRALAQKLEQAAQQLRQRCPLDAVAKESHIEQFQTAAVAEAMKSTAAVRDTLAPAMAQTMDLREQTIAELYSDLGLDRPEPEA